VSVKKLTIIDWSSDIARFFVELPRPCDGAYFLASGSAEIRNYIRKSRCYTIVKHLPHPAERDIKFRRSGVKICRPAAVPAEGSSLSEPYSTYYTRVKVINNGGTTSGGSSVLRSLFPTPFYVDYDAVSSFQPPATPRVPHSTRTASLSSTPSPLPVPALCLSFSGTTRAVPPLLPPGTYTIDSTNTIHARRSWCLNVWSVLRDKNSSAARISD